MTTAYWCIFAACILPYVFTIIAKTGPNFSNHTPREYLAGLDGYRRRANYAQMNGFEALPFFIASVLIAQQHTLQDRIDLLALAFIAARILHGICYLCDWPTLRSLFFTIGFACCISLIIP